MIKIIDDTTYLVEINGKEVLIGREPDNFGYKDEFGQMMCKEIMAKELLNDLSK